MTVTVTLKEPTLLDGEYATIVKVENFGTAKWLDIGDGIFQITTAERVYTFPAANVYGTLAEDL